MPGPTSLLKFRLHLGEFRMVDPIARMAKPHGIVNGTDGNLWFALGAAGKSGRITPAGVMTEYPLPRQESSPFYQALGGDGALWFTGKRSSRVGDSYRIQAHGKAQFVTRMGAGKLGLRGKTMPTGSQTWFLEDASQPITGTDVGRGEIPDTMGRPYFRIRGAGANQACLVSQDEPTTDQGTRGPMKSERCEAGSTPDVHQLWAITRTNDGNPDATFTLRNQSSRYLSIAYQVEDTCVRLGNKTPSSILWSNDNTSGTSMWRLVAAGAPGRYRIQSVFTGLFLQRQSDGALNLVPYGVDATLVWNLEPTEVTPPPNPNPNPNPNLPKVNPSPCSSVKPGECP